MKKYFFIITGLLLFSSSSVDAQLKSTQECLVNGEIESSTLPSSIKTDETKDIYIKAKNIGTCDWKRYDVKLVVTLARGPSGSRMQRDELMPDRPLDLSANVVPKLSGSFDYEIKGPNYVGDYTIEYQLTYKGTKFGKVLKKYIKVEAK